LATFREIKRRITGIQNTEKITRAMKMVAAVKFRRAQESILSARPYARKIDEIIKNLIPTLDNVKNDLLEERKTNKICIVVVTGDRGFAGSFNTNLIKEAENIVKVKYSNYFNNNTLTLITVGKKGYDYFFKRDYSIYAKYTGIFDRLDFTTARKMVSEILSGYTSHSFDKVIIIYNEFKSVIQSRIIEEQFMPILSFDTEEEDNTLKKYNYIYEPSPSGLVDYLLPRHLNTQIWRILLESFTSEQAARMMAMDTATTNANDLIKALQLYYNQARQAAITKEILEVVSGAEALKETS
jgi:F-type H+-transporting ATPase subunit gamma